MTAPATHPVDKRGTVTSGGTAQNIMAANPKRIGWRVYNASDITLYVDDLTTATTGSIALPPGSMLDSEDGRGVSLKAISLLGATTGKAFLAWEW